MTIQEIHTAIANNQIVYWQSALYQITKEPCSQAEAKSNSYVEYSYQDEHYLRITNIQNRSGETLSAFALKHCSVKL